MSPYKAAADSIMALRVWCEAQVPGMEFNEKQRKSFDTLLTKAIGGAIWVHDIRREKREAIK